MVETQTENKKPITHDLRMKYVAESFSVTPNLVWKGDFKKEIIDDYRFKSKEYHNYWDDDNFVMHGNGKEIHEKLMETNETYALYFKEFGKRNPLTVSDNEDLCAYLDTLIKNNILIVNLNDTEKTRIEIEINLYNKLIANIEKNIKSAENELQSAIKEINEPASYHKIETYDVIEHEGRYTNEIDRLEGRVYKLFIIRGKIENQKNMKRIYESQRDEKFF